MKSIVLQCPELTTISISDADITNDCLGALASRNGTRVSVCPCARVPRLGLRDSITSASNVPGCNSIPAKRRNADDFAAQLLERLGDKLPTEQDATTVLDMWEFERNDRKNACPDHREHMPGSQGVFHQ